jgi:hypothetical protein
VGTAFEQHILGGVSSKPGLRAATSFESSVLNGGRQKPAKNNGDAKALEAVALSQSDGLEQRIDAAREGDTFELMPYQPTPSINPPRPRTRAAGWDKDSNTMFVQFRDGAIYAYHDVERREWNNLRRVKSVGRAINRTFNAKPYERIV